MSKTVSHSMSTRQFMALAGNVLKRSFFDSGRVPAKRVFSEIVKGKRVGLLRLRLEDQSTLDCLATLDCSEYRGDINFSQFRRHLGLLLTNYSALLGGEKKIPVLSDDSGNNHVFSVPALTADRDQVNALVLGWEMTAPATVEFKLQYIDPDQFRREGAAQTA